MDFEVRLIDGSVAVIGEEVAFKEENGRLLALNEDGEPFGVVPNRYVEPLRELAKQNQDIVATVVARDDGVSTIRITGITSSIAQNDAFQSVAATKQDVRTSTSVGEAHIDAASIETNSSEEPKKHKHRTAIVVVVVTALIFLVLFVFALSHKSSDVSDAMYNVGREALEVVDDYYDGYLTSYEAYKELIDVQDRAEEIKDRSDYSDDANVYLCITFLKVEFFTDSNDEDIAEYVTRLENCLYLY